MSSTTFVLTGSPENLAATRRHGFRVIGMKEGRLLVLEDQEFVPAEEVVGELEHVRKWPAEHWHLAFQGQLRPVSDADAQLLEDHMRRRTAAHPAA